jgi:hypothetical protein
MMTALCRGLWPERWSCSKAKIGESDLQEANKEKRDMGKEWTKDELETLLRDLKDKISPIVQDLCCAASILQDDPDNNLAWLDFYKMASRFHRAMSSLKGIHPAEPKTILDVWMQSFDNRFPRPWEVTAIRIDPDDGTVHTRKEGPDEDCPFGALCQLAFQLFEPGEPSDMASRRTELLALIQSYEW